MDEPLERDFYTPKEVAGLLFVTRSCLDRWRRIEYGPPWYRVVGRIRYDKAKFHRWHKGLGID